MRGSFPHSPSPSVRPTQKVTSAVTSCCESLAFWISLFVERIVIPDPQGIFLLSQEETAR